MTTTAKMAQIQHDGETCETRRLRMFNLQTLATVFYLLPYPQCIILHAEQSDRALRKKPIRCVRHLSYCKALSLKRSGTTVSPFDIPQHTGGSISVRCFSPSRTLTLRWACIKVLGRNIIVPNFGQDVCSTSFAEAAGAYLASIMIASLIWGIPIVDS